VRQEFMRHSDLRLTSGVYTDVEQLPTMGAIMALPSFKAEEAESYAQIDSQNTDAESPDESRPCANDCYYRKIRLDSF